MADKAVIMDAIAAIGLDVSGINDEAVYAAGTGSVTGVKELPDDIGVALPAFLVLAGDVTVIPGNWERQTWIFEASVWTSYQPRGERYRELVNLQEPLLAAFRAKAKGFLAAHGDTGVQSSLALRFGQIEGRQWQRGEHAPWYLVLPAEIELKVNRAVTYLPA